jgi:GT2 family glycosyltransferase
VASLVARYPEQGRHFHGPTCIFKDFSQRPWEIHKDIHPPGITPGALCDVHNLCLYKRSVHEKIGYIDPNFFPAYYSDNDYCRRANLTDIRACHVHHSAYFHFWSRTIHQGDGGSTNYYFQQNRDFYHEKWRGDFGQEQSAVPFNGRPKELCPGVILPPEIAIRSRADEAKIVEHWKVKS